MNELISCQPVGVHNPQFMPQNKFPNPEACSLSQINENGWIDR